MGSMVKQHLDIINEFNFDQTNEKLIVFQKYRIPTIY